MNMTKGERRFRRALHIVILTLIASTTFIVMLEASDASDQRRRPALAPGQSPLP